jgi:hypothetical protein
MQLGKGKRGRKAKGKAKGDGDECPEDSQNPFIGNFFRSSDLGFFMR